MQDLSHYNAAAFLTGGMKAGPQFVRITRGPRTGTVARVIAINSKYYSAHNYQLSCKGRKKFWVQGKDLEYVANYSGETEYVLDEDYQVEHTDMMGRKLEVGQTIIFHRGADGPVEMVMGTIKRINKSGAVYAKVFKTARSEELPEGLVKVGVPSSSLAVDKDLITGVMLAKMSVL